jgi:hypothetical protein
MVFRKDRYPSNWKGIRAGVVLRANNRCEECMAPNGDVIARGAPGSRDDGTYMTMDGYVFDAEDGRNLGQARGSEYNAGTFVKIVLTVAHVDHDEAHNDPSNLRALCQRHHLRLDAHDNARRRRASRAARVGQGELFDRRPA